MSLACDTLWTNARLATMVAGPIPYGVIENGAIAAEGGRIVFAGPRAGMPAVSPRETIDCEGRWITPGLIDCHTHLVHGGDRAAEFELRLKGATYEEIARAGGGILSTVTATRAADEDSLFASARKRLTGLLAEGVTAIEIKSGYGLDEATEMRQLRVARRIAAEQSVTVRATYLGAHAVPPEFKGRADAYIDFIINSVLPGIAGQGLADAIDVFCEGIGFSPAQSRRVLEAGRAHGLGLKIHAEQLSNLGGAKLAAELGALSADHLEYLDEAGAAAMAKSRTAAVLLPGAFYFLREKQLPPVEALRRHGVPIAIATDCNPGSSPVSSILTTLNMACTLFRLTPEEALAGVTREAAGALGMLSDTGTLEPGKSCDLAIWSIERPAELCYRIGFNPLHSRIWRGR